MVTLHPAFREIELVPVTLVLTHMAGFFFI